MVKNKTLKTSPQGSIYVTQTGYIFKDEDVTADHLFAYKTKNIYGRGVSRKQRNLIFTDKYTVEMINPDGDADEEKSTHLQKMLDKPDVNFWLRMQQTFEDVFWFGMFLSNPVWEWIGNEYTLTEFRHLPPYTFRKQGQFQGIIKSQGQFLKGIVLMQDDKDATVERMECWQFDGVNTNKIDNIFTIKEAGSEFVAGDPMVYPLVPIFEMLKFSWNRRMQQVNRNGVLTYAKLMAGADESDIRDAEKILKNINRDVSFKTNENIEIMSMNLSEDATVPNTIEVLNNLIIDYLSPASFISTQTGTLIGGTNQPQEEIMSKYVEGQHQWLKNEYEAFLKKYYCDVNGYDDDWMPRITIPKSSVDRSTVFANQAQIGATTKCLHPNEVRAKLEAEEADDNQLIAIFEAWGLLETGKTQEERDKQALLIAKGQQGGVVQPPGTPPQVNQGNQSNEQQQSPQNRNVPPGLAAWQQRQKITLGQSEPAPGAEQDTYTELEAAIDVLSKKVREQLAAD